MILSSNYMVQVVLFSVIVTRNTLCRFEPHTSQSYGMDYTSVSWLESYNVAGGRSKVSSTYDTQNLFVFSSEPRYLTRYFAGCNVRYIVTFLMSK
jgi:hypothetical protein